MNTTFDVSQVETECTSSQGGYLSEFFEKYIFKSRSTKPYVFENIINKEFLGSHENLFTFDEKSRSVNSKLMNLGCFDSCRTKLVMSPDNKIVAHVKLKGSPKYLFNIGSYVDSATGNVSANAKLSFKNLFGTAESFNIDVSSNPTGVAHAHNLSAKFTKPLFSLDPTGLNYFEVLLNNELCEFQNSSHVYSAINLNTSLSNGDHVFGHNLSVRNTGILRSASQDMLREGGKSLKNSIYYTLKRDTTNQLDIPETGNKYHLNAELAGLLGDTTHLKLSAAIASYFSLKNGLTFQLSNKIGTLLSKSPSKYADRIVISEPTWNAANSFWGFTRVGPQCGNDVMGGEYYWNTSLKCYYPLIKNSMYFCTFGQIGNLVRHSDKSKMFSFNDSLNRVRSSIGLGLTLALSGFRLNVMYSIPVSYANTDSVKNIQFGLNLASMIE